MNYAWFLIGMLAMALIEWLWTMDWSKEEVDTDFLTDPAQEDEYYADPK